MSINSLHFLRKSSQWLLSNPRFLGSFTLQSVESVKKEHWKKRQKIYFNYLKIAAGITIPLSLGVVYLMWKEEKRRAQSDTGKLGIATEGSLPSQSLNRKFSAREKRFLQFSSVEYEGRIYMTPQDFCESIIEAEPRPRLKRKNLTKSEIDDDLKKIPKLNKYKENLFRHMGTHGLISFSEYLFLLTILIKSHSGFRIAFTMLDKDGNERLDREEFKIMEKVFSSVNKKCVGDCEEAENIFSSHKDVLTMLTVYFFGKNGDKELKFEDFYKFMDNIQTEVLQMEFYEFSKGADIISELDLARILLRYTQLNQEEYQKIFQRFLIRLQGFKSKGITFREFREFNIFLNNMDDFQIAMKMYRLADKAITEEEFTRAVYICTGQTMCPRLVRIIFLLFDNDGDGLLSYQEFVAIMQDRINRGLKHSTRNEGFYQGIKKCIKQESAKLGS